MCTRLTIQVKNHAIDNTAVSTVRSINTIEHKKYWNSPTFTTGRQYSTLEPRVIEVSSNNVYPSMWQWDNMFYTQITIQFKNQAIDSTAVPTVRSIYRNELSQ